MYTCLEDGLIVTAGKETSSGEGEGEVKLWSADMGQSRSVSLGRPGGAVVRSVCRSKVSTVEGFLQIACCAICRAVSAINFCWWSYGDTMLCMYVCVCVRVCVCTG